MEEVTVGRFIVSLSKVKLYFRRQRRQLCALDSGASAPFIYLIECAPRSRNWRDAMLGKGRTWPCRLLRVALSRSSNVWAALMMTNDLASACVQPGLSRTQTRLFNARLANAYKLVSRPMRRHNPADSLPICSALVRGPTFKQHAFFLVTSPCASRCAQSAAMVDILKTCLRRHCLKSRYQIESSFRGQRCVHSGSKCSCMRFSLLRHVGEKRGEKAKSSIPYLRGKHSISLENCDSKSDLNASGHREQQPRCIVRGFSSHFLTTCWYAAKRGPTRVDLPVEFFFTARVCNLSEELFGETVEAGDTALMRKDVYLLVSIGTHLIAAR